MRWIPLLLLTLACRTAEKDRADYMEQALVARENGEWDKALELMQQAVRADGIDIAARIELADTYLIAFNEIDKARDIYFTIGKRNKPRSLYGLGRCALWEGQEEVGRDFLRRSLEERPTVLAAIDLGARVGDKERARILALPLGGRRWELFRSAYRQGEGGPNPPPDPSYALARARLATGAAQDTELRAHLADSCANLAAQRAYARYLLGERLFGRNMELRTVVKEGE
ncbi:MAG: tetratricopeptide repeat protein [Planctomycetota bacterium]